MVRPSLTVGVRNSHHLPWTRCLAWADNAGMPHTDFDLDSLARYLHVSPAQVQKMAERGTLPGRRVAGAWRFPRPEINEWLEERIGAADEEDLARVEDVLNPPGTPVTDSIVRIAELLLPVAIALPLDVRTKPSVIDAMVKLAAETGKLWDADRMAHAVRARESLHPTALESGVALLHPRRPLPDILEGPLLALGITRQGIPFGESHGQLTDVFFLICSTDDAGHLRILARLSRLIGREGFLPALRATKDASSAHELVRQFETRLES